MSTASATQNMLGSGLHRKTSTSPNRQDSQQQQQRPPPNRHGFTTVRRGSEGDPLNASLNIANPSSSSGWARRVANDTMATTRERSQLLRTISHLDKDQDSGRPAVERGEGDTASPFTRFDLVPPPEYRARPQRKSLDVRRSRGPSAGEGSPLDLSTNNSQLSIPLSPSLASQGRAKAALAAEKLRRLSISQLATRSKQQESPTSGGPSSNLQTPPAGPSTRKKVTNKEKRVEESTGGGGSSSADLDVTISNSVGNESPRDQIGSNGPLAQQSSPPSDDFLEQPGCGRGAAAASRPQPGKSASASESDAETKRQPTTAIISTSAACHPAATPSSDVATSQPSVCAVDPDEGNRAPAIPSEVSKSDGVQQAGSPLDSPLHPNTPITPQSTSRASRISFDPSLGASSISSEPPVTSHPPYRRTSVLCSGQVEEETSTMQPTQPRRGSEPMGEGGKRRGSAFKLGMIKLTGSSVEVNNLGQRRGSHLEMRARRRGSEEVERMASPAVSTTDTSPRSRLSFSFARPAPLHDGARPSSFSLFSKLNKSRDQLHVSTLDADEESKTGTQRRRKTSEAGSVARQFILKTLGRSSRSSISTTGLDTPSAMQANSCKTTTDSASGPANGDEECASQVFASAFGAPQRSDLNSAQAFESRGEGAVADDSRRGSNDSAATSFFSIADTASHHGRPMSRFPGLSTSSSSPALFDRSGAGGGGDHAEPQPRFHSAAQRVIAPETEEGPLGERRADSSSSRQLKLGLPNDYQEPEPGMQQQQQQRRESPISSPSDQSSSATNHTSETMASSLGQPGETAALVTKGTTTLGVIEQRKGKERGFDGRGVGDQAARRPSLGIDEEQDAQERQRAAEGGHRVEAGEGMHESGGEQGNNQDTRSGGSSGNGNSRRPGRSSRLSHLPRLDSMRVVSGGAGGGGEDGRGGGDDKRGKGVAVDRTEDEEHSDDTADEGQDGNESDGTETDTGTEGSVESGGERQNPTSTTMAGSVAHRRHESSGEGRPRPGEIELPPAPSFATASSTSAAPSAVGGGVAGAVGKDTWTRFDSSLTPLDSPRVFATPRPMGATSVSLSQRITPVNSAGQTPRGGNEAGVESSYFALRPATSRPATSKGNADMPPPSPSIITRSRAPSTASMRSLRSPVREVPPLPPMPPMSPMSIRSMRSPSASTSGPSVSSPPPAPILGRHGASPTAPQPKAASARPIFSKEGVEREEGGRSTLPALPVNAASAVHRRPGLYQQQSRSLIDLSSVEARNLKEPVQSPTAAVSAAVLPSKEINEGEQDSGLQSPTGTSTPGGLRRRRSMFEVGAQPPPYAVIHKRPEGQQMIFPREEEGKESLPRYHCSVHIEGYLPRKMEFSSPGVQAKDRSWRRQYFVLHGTCLKVFKNDLSGENLLAKGAWGAVEGVHVHKDPMNEDGPAAPVNNSGVNGAKDASQASSNHHHPGLNGSPSGGTTSSGLGAAVEAVTALTGNIYSSGTKASLVKEYSLQGAESGLAADYLKRRHVVRLRVEGEQFLLQTRNDRHVVDWIEAFQAATNVALDLERRPMPKFITLPRRRRRRRREGGGGGTGATPTPATAREVAEIAEAQRRSIAEAGGARAGNNGPRLHPPRPLGLPGDESPHPSAAFDDMLREEHDEMMRQDAGDI